MFHQGRRMKFQKYFNLFFVILLTSMQMCATNAFMHRAVLKFSELLPYLLFPFVMPSEIFYNFSLSTSMFMAISVFLESYIVHRMLHRSYIFIVPRMLMMHCASFITAMVTFLIFWFAALFDASFGLIVHVIFNFFVMLIVLFYVRWKIFCKMFVWFDPNLSKILLRKMLLYALLSGYLCCLVMKLIFSITFAH